MNILGPVLKSPLPAFRHIRGISWPVSAAWLRRCAFMCVRASMPLERGMTRGLGGEGCMSVSFDRHRVCDERLARSETFRFLVKICETEPSGRECSLISSTVAKLSKLCQKHRALRSAPQVELAALGEDVKGLGTNVPLLLKDCSSCDPDLDGGRIYGVVVTVRSLYNAGPGSSARRSLANVPCSNC